MNLVAYEFRVCKHCEGRGRHPVYDRKGEYFDSADCLACDRGLYIVNDPNNPQHEARQRMPKE